MPPTRPPYPLELKRQIVELVRDALALDDVEIRDATVQAAELWGDRDILPVLKSHSEPEPWLRDYIFHVINDLGNNRR